ncbi:hypothetical protein TeGR_g10406, partial [Tetraparma gracilis]
MYSHVSHAKGRWFGKSLLATFSAEFQTYPPGYYEQAIRSGRLHVNGQLVPTDYIISEHDTITHASHRHEPPVRSLDSFISAGPDFVAISKPPCLPCHPCGSYHFNSVSTILPPLLPPLATPAEARAKNTSRLFPIHRLDRLTSGVLLSGRNSAFSSAMGKAIQSGDVAKFYVAKVRGLLSAPPSSPSLLSDRANIDEMMRGLKANELPSKFSSITVDAGTEIVDKKKGVYVCGTPAEVTTKK